MALSKEVRDWVEACNSEHMMPVVTREHFQLIRDTEEGNILTPEADSEYRGAEDAAEAYGVPIENVECVFGYFAQLAAPGYLDQTEWIGPYDSADEALEALYEMYGD